MRSRGCQEQNTCQPGSRAEGLRVSCVFAPLPLAHTLRVLLGLTSSDRDAQRHSPRKHIQRFKLVSQNRSVCARGLTHIDQTDAYRCILCDPTTLALCAGVSLSEFEVGQSFAADAAIVRGWFSPESR